ncbi:MULTISPECIES: FAD-dependent oxidoreductase [Streptomyces]|uniref:FAD-dependent oxidoreductase n=1 Tax=Streptomyces TaxID=1883 RepID=UPI000FBD32E8|nr:NAD(P)/FAD-dependent oxidoreductase [Streptomyces sp. ADI97-07]RPK69601.1 2-octaprenyl-6-methoxyphenyl hydroxylase [Streptomyces sp. ADI97-07]
MKNPDVLIAGAGPGGCASALGLAEQGATVLLMDPAPARQPSLSGEWIHPAGVAVLQRLGVEVDGASCAHHQGFIVHPPDRELPITLEHPGSSALSMPHQTLTAALLQMAAAHRGITQLSGHRLLSATEHGLAQTTDGHYRSALVVGADGRSSAVRRALRPAETPPVKLSRTAGIVLPLATLPTEGYGHVILGAPGPILLFRLTPDQVRITFDIPVPGPPQSALIRHLLEEYLPHLPGALRPAARIALTSRMVQWASNTYRPRDFHGRRRCALVGDAVGHNHPLAAHGLSLALLDAEQLAQAPHLGAYRRRSRSTSWAPAHVSAVLGRLFLAPDALSTGLRRSLFAEWHGSPLRTQQAMRQLALLDTRRWPLAATFARTAGRTLTDSGQPDLPALPRRARELLAWGGWLGRTHPPYTEGAPRDHVS